MQVQVHYENINSNLKNLAEKLINKEIRKLEKNYKHFLEGANMHVRFNQLRENFTNISFELKLSGHHNSILVAHASGENLTKILNDNYKKLVRQLRKLKDKETRKNEKNK